MGHEHTVCDQDIMDSGRRTVLGGRGKNKKI